MTETKIINIGTKNRPKIEALEDLLKDYPILKDYKVKAVNASSEVAEQPLSLDETIQGAINRAKNSFRDCDYSVGIESGLMQVPHSKSGYLEFCACAIYDGNNIHIGLSSAWEFSDPSIFLSMVNDKLDLCQAVYKAGLTEDPRLGESTGVVGLASKGKLPRKQYNQEAIRTALIHLN
jgi:inosine/xanthosine triphosphatase